MKFIDKKKSATFQLMTIPTQLTASMNSVILCSDDANDSNSIFADAPDDYDDEDEGGGGVSNQPSSLSRGAPSFPDHVKREMGNTGARVSRLWI